MSRSENTLVALEAALERIVEGKPKRIPATRKLSLRAVEEEAKLGNGSGYYYPDFVQKVKQIKADIAESKGLYIQPEIQSVRSKLKEEKRIKNNYKDKYEAVKQKLSDFAAAQHHLNDKLIKALSDKEELEIENTNLRAELAKLKRSKVVAISNKY
ncbi:hypothetical protein [Shewanella indica]|uniref:hypothetical protein n=1 Tax=Shewanella indica TaxID=768528 RepID=UPI00399B51E1